MNPDIYLLDEPSSNLDMTAIKALREHLRLIKAQGKTILIAEHRLYYLMDIADRIVYLEQGHIAGEFTPMAFRELSANTRKEMGLRAIDLKAESIGKRFVVTHDYGFVCRSCSRMIHFDNGTLVDDLLLSEQNEKKIHTIFNLEEVKDHV